MDWPQVQVFVADLMLDKSTSNPTGCVSRVRTSSVPLCQLYYIYCHSRILIFTRLLVRYLCGESGFVP